MHPLRQLIRARRRAEARRRRGEDGQVLVELFVALAVAVVILIAASILLTTIANQSTAALQTGQSNEAAAVAMQTIQGYLHDAVTPNNAAQSAGATLPLGTTGSYCWNNSFPGSGTSWMAANQPPTYGIIVAHDYDLEFCGYPQGSGYTGTPHVYEIFMNYSTCKGDQCDVDIVDFGTTYSTSDYDTSGSCLTASPATCKLVAAIHHVWCDTQCQATGNGTVDSIRGISCYTYALASVTPASGSCANATLQPDPRNDNYPNALAYSPPLFTYFSESTTNAQQPTLGYQITNLISIGNSDYNPMDLSSQEAGTGMSAINEIRVQLTVLSGTVKSYNLEGQPGTSSSLNVYLPNLLSTP